MPNGHRHKRREFNKKPGGFEHDDRNMSGSGGHQGGGSVFLRRVSFKKTGMKPPRQKGWDHKMRAAAFLDDDVDMITSQHGDRKHGKLQNSDKQRFKHQHFNEHRRLTASITHWYRVNIKSGNKYDKEYVLKLIQNFIKPVAFDPIAYTVYDEESTFIVGDYKMAEAIMKANLKITLPNGWKLSLRVRPISLNVEVDDNMLAAIKEALASRFNSYTKSLNLSAFHRDPAFMKRSLFCPLNRPNVMTAVINIVGESAPDLQSLDLSNNLLSATDHMKIMIEKVPHLKSLILGCNKLRDLKSLNPLRGLLLTEILLDDNSLCDRYKDRDSYIRAVRDIFPKVIKLDHVDLPPPILFVDEDVGQLPQIQASFMSDPAGAAIVKQFLEQYYQLYDAADRQPIAQAYHENAEFSLSCTHAESSSPSYMAESRNLLRVPQIERRMRMLKKGRYSIVNFLNTLPQTQHDPSSFAVDLVIFSPQVIEMVVMGVFKDKDGKKNPIRSFARSFIIVPLGSGFCITNEMLTISPATEDQLRKAFKQISVLPEVVSSSMANINISSAEEDNIAAKQQMVTNLAMKTGMNLLWSEKCLAETEWNYARAEYAFGELHKAGTIPAEAFIK